MPNKADRDQEAKGHGGRGGGGSGGDRGGNDSLPDVSWGSEAEFDQAHGLGSDQGPGKGPSAYLARMGSTQLPEVTWTDAPKLDPNQTMDRIKLMEEGLAMSAPGAKNGLFNPAEYKNALNAGIEEGLHTANPEFAQRVDNFKQRYSEQNLTDMAFGLLAGGLSGVPAIGSLASYAFDSWATRAQTPDETPAEYAGRLNAINNRSSLAGPAVGLAGALGGVNTGPVPALAGGIVSAAQNIHVPGSAPPQADSLSGTKPQVMRTNPPPQSGQVQTSSAPMAEPAPATAPYMNHPPTVQEIAPPTAPQINLQRYSTWMPGRRIYKQR